MEDLKKCPYFENLDLKSYELLSSFAVKKHYQKGSVLFYEKEWPKSLLLLTEGVLKVYKTDQKNNEIILHMFRPTTLVAEMAILENIPFPASATFETDGTIIEIDFEKFQKVFLDSSPIALAFFKSLSKKIKNLENVIALNVVLDSTARLAKFLYDHPDDNIRHYQLAEHLHMTPETLSRTFKKLLTLGLVKKSGKEYEVLHREGLRALFD